MEKTQNCEKTTDEAKVEVDHMEKGELEVKKSKKRKKDKKERSPAVDEDALGPGKDLSKNELNIIDASSEELGKDLDDNVTEKSKRAELLARNGKLLETKSLLKETDPLARLINYHSRQNQHWKHTKQFTMQSTNYIVYYSSVVNCTCFHLILSKSSLIRV